MKATEILKEEHRVIKRMLRILGKLCEIIEKEGKVEKGDMKKILEFITVFADKCHHGKEEDLLFPAMEFAGIPKEGGPIGVMLYEHNVGRNFVKGIANGIEELEKGNEKVRKEIVENARGYIELLSAHIEKEDNILYPMADMHLSEEQMEKLEEEVIGKGTQEAFHKLVENLESIYG